MEQTEGVINHLINYFRAFFNEISERLVEYDAQQQENDVAAFLYAHWSNAYEIGVNSLSEFEKACKLVKEGNIKEAKSLLDIPQQAFLVDDIDGQKRLLYLYLVNEKNPLCLFNETIKVSNRHIMNTFHTISAQQPDATEDLDTICSLVTSFQFPDPSNNGEKKEDSLFSKLIGPGLGFALGFALWGPEIEF